MVHAICHMPRLSHGMCTCFTGMWLNHMACYLGPPSVEHHFLICCPHLLLLLPLQWILHAYSQYVGQGNDARNNITRQLARRAPPTVADRHNGHEGARQSSQEERYDCLSTSYHCVLYTPLYSPSLPYEHTFRVACRANALAFRTSSSFLRRFRRVSGTFGSFCSLLGERKTGGTVKHTDSTFPDI